jgi:hypothetical protein
MMPYEFVDAYHSLDVSDPRLGLDVTLDLKKYRSGWFKEDQAEAVAVLDAVAHKCCGLRRGNAELPAVFTIGRDDRADPNEPFYCAGIRRAFGSRGSPEEIQDALRLAVLGGITSIPRAKAYAEKWFGQDCNSFAGNWLGISPMIGIPFYAKGFGKGHISNATKDLLDCRDLLPLPPRDDPEAVVAGDVLVTYGSPHPVHHWRWRHIQIVQSVANLSYRGAGEGTDLWNAQVQIAGWGGAGGSAVHKGRYDGKLVADLLAWRPADYNRWRPLLSALSTELPGRTLVGFAGEDPDHNDALVFFLDSSSLDCIPNRGLHIRNRFEGH